jgi:tRNA-specific adenosine deaminase 1
VTSISQRIFELHDGDGGKKDGALNQEEFARALKYYADSLNDESDVGNPPEAITTKRLIRYAIMNGLPYIGFGFIDNFLMITMGEAIDQTLGASLGISTMAAAGLGNLISDVAGLGLADQVESLVHRAGLVKGPSLTLAQRQELGPRVAKVTGMVIGISIGCIIGMMPLLYL